MHVPPTDMVNAHVLLIRLQARDYCMKEDTRLAGPWHRGHIMEDPAPGKRTDFEAMYEDLKAGMSVTDILKKHPKTAKGCMKFIDRMADIFAQERIERLIDFHAYPWQSKVIEYVSGPVHSREVLVILDRQGGAGKSMLAKHLADTRDVAVLTTGKHADIAYAYKGQGVCIFDFPRCMGEERVPFSIIEQIKNGMMFSGKYESGLKRFNPPHVLIFCNWEIDYSQMSDDRWVVVEIMPDRSHKVIKGRGMGAALIFA